MPYAPRPYATPRARNPAEANDLHQYKLGKRYPFLTLRGYDMEHANDFRAFGKFVRPDCLPNVKGIVFDNSYFWLHSQSTLHGCITYTFIHAISEAGTVVFRPLMFDKSELSAAYRYAIAYGCKVNKKPTLDITILDFMADAMEDIDLFVETIQLPTVSRVSRVKHLTPYGKG